MLSFIVIVVWFLVVDCLGMLAAFRGILFSVFAFAGWLHGTVCFPPLQMSVSPIFPELYYYLLAY